MRAVVVCVVAGIANAAAVASLLWSEAADLSAQHAAELLALEATLRAELEGAGAGESTWPAELRYRAASKHRAASLASACSLGCRDDTAAFAELAGAPRFNPLQDPGGKRLPEGKTRPSTKIYPAERKKLTEEEKGWNTNTVCKPDKPNPTEKDKKLCAELPADECKQHSKCTLAEKTSEELKEGQMNSEHQHLDTQKKKKRHVFSRATLEAKDLDSLTKFGEAKGVVAEDKIEKEVKFTRQGKETWGLVLHQGTLVVKEGKGDLKKGDKIKKVNDDRVDNPHGAIKAFKSAMDKAGDKLTLVVEGGENSRKDYLVQAILYAQAPKTELEAMDLDSLKKIGEAKDVDQSTIDAATEDDTATLVQAILGAQVYTKTQLEAMDLDSLKKIGEAKIVEQSTIDAATEDDTATLVQAIIFAQADARRMMRK